MYEAEESDLTPSTASSTVGSRHLEGASLPVRTLVSSFGSRLGLLLGIVIGLAGCAGGPTKGGALVPAPARVRGPGDQVEMLAVTTRCRSDGGEMFSGDRALPGEISFAQITVSIPPNHVSGKIEWPSRAPGNAEKHFTTRDRGYLDKAGFHAQLGAALVARAPGDREVLLFIHGYNTAFDEAIFRLAQFDFDSEYKGIPVAFSLPSRSEVLGYVYDRDSATLSRDALEDTLRGLLADSHVTKVNILAHSIGAMLLMETLRQFDVAGDRVLTSHIGSIVLAAPDIDVQVFRYQLDRLGGRMPAPSTIFVSIDDRALDLSSKLAGKMPRLGDYSGAAEFSSAGITVVDLSAVDAGSHDPMKHDKVFANEDLVRMVGNQFNQGYGFGGHHGENGAVLIQGLGKIGGSVGEALNVIVVEPAQALTKMR